MVEINKVTTDISTKKRVHTNERMGNMLLDLHDSSGTALAIKFMIAEQPYIIRI